MSRHTNETEKANYYYCTCCGNEIYLHPEMSSGYCKLCGERVTLRSAMNCELGIDAILRLSKKELYGIKKRFGVYPSIGALKTAAGMGNIPANTLLSLYYYEQKDYSSMVEYADVAAEDENWDGYFYYAVGMYKTGKSDDYEKLYKIIDGAIEGGFELSETEDYCDAEFRVIKKLYEDELEAQRRAAASRAASSYNSSSYGYDSSSYGGYSSGSSINDKDYDDFMFMNGIIDRMRNDPAWGDDTRVSEYDPYSHDPESFPDSSQFW